MEIRRETTGHWAGWWYISKPSEEIVRYIKYSVQPLYRQYDRQGCWWVHDKFIDGIKELSRNHLLHIEDDPYAVLHLRPTAPQAIIKAVWRELAKTLHPDQGGDRQAFQEALEAYEKLTRE